MATGKQGKVLDLVYGRSGIGKTRWWLKLAEWMYAQHGLKTRCYMGDGGFLTVYNSGLVEDGIVEMCHYSERPHPFETSQLCCRGFWPANVDDSTSPLVAPTVDSLTPYGLFVFEGLTAMGNYIMGHKAGGLAEQSSRGVKIGQDAPYMIKDGGMVFGGNPLAHFGVAQGHMLHRIQESAGLPGWVLWTSHQRDAEDAETAEKFVGPDCCGKALTSKIGGHFGNTIHLDSASRRVKKKDGVTGKEVDSVIDEYRAYTRTHLDPDGQTFKKYYANNRCWTPEVMPEYITPPDPVVFYQKLVEGRRKAAPPQTSTRSAAGAA